jgi:hypothetical protein
MKRRGKGHDLGKRLENDGGNEWKEIVFVYALMREIGKRKE